MDQIYANALVKGIDHFDIPDPGCQPASYHIYADGCVGIAFCESANDVLFNATKTGKLFLYGQTVKPLKILYSSRFVIDVIYLQPYAIKQLFKIDAHELTDTCVDIELLDKQLANRMLEAFSRKERLDIMLSNISSKQKNHNGKPNHESIAYATAMMMQESGNISISDLRAEVFLTERTFERQFLQYVGVTPSQYAKICRFYKALQQLNKNSFKSLTDVAHSSGYTDQPHFIHQFKEFTSITPSEYLRAIRN